LVLNNDCNERLGKLAANRLRYDIVSVLVKSQLAGLMSAASDGKG
jgi:hypothetical protein